VQDSGDVMQSEMQSNEMEVGSSLLDVNIPSAHSVRYHCKYSNKTFYTWASWLDKTSTFTISNTKNVRVRVCVHIEWRECTGLWNHFKRLIEGQRSAGWSFRVSIHKETA